MHNQNYIAILLPCVCDVTDVMEIIFNYAHSIEINYAWSDPWNSVHLWCTRSIPRVGYTRLTGASVFSGSRINESRIDGSHGFAISRLHDTYRQFLLIIMNISMSMCFVCFVFVIYYDLQVHLTSRARSIFTPTLQAWITNAVVIDVFITTPTRRKSVLKAWKYYAHTASHSVSHSPASV